MNDNLLNDKGNEWHKGQQKTKGNKWQMIYQASSNPWGPHTGNLGLCFWGQTQALSLINPWGPRTGNLGLGFWGQTQALILGVLLPELKQKRNKILEKKQKTKYRVKNHKRGHTKLYGRISLGSSLPEQKQKRNKILEKNKKTQNTG